MLVLFEKGSALPLTQTDCKSLEEDAWVFYITADDAPFNFKRSEALDVVN